MHARLSILDLSSAAHQPMSNEDATVWITYNGEIYNFRELREELVAKGHRFKSRTDSEVLLHLYEEEGEALVQRLVGMFAFAIYDVRRRRFLLARDRLGIKPLYYADYAGAFLFASEIKGILRTGLVPSEVDWQSIWDYFTFAFIPHPHTAFQGIQQLPPAHTLAFDLERRRYTLNRYWSPLASAPTQHHQSAGAIQERLRHLMREAVRSELVSDVPLGLFFSGGIDSTLLAALMSEHASSRVQTFTVVFRGAERFLHDDLEYARLASKALGTEHHELTVELKTPEDFLGMVEHTDQPFGNPTLYLQYLIAKTTRQHVTVALSGVGGDELFGGYPKYRLFPFSTLLGAIPAWCGRGTRNLLGLIREDTWVPVLRQAKRLLQGVGQSLPEQYLRWSYSLTEQEKQRLFKRDGPVSGAEPSVRIIRQILRTLPSGTSRYEKFFCAELETFLADNLLEYTDKATMAVALETRVPFLDHRLVEFGAQIPFRDKITLSRSKAVLIDAFRKEIPAPIAKAPKRGFSPPIALWMEQVLDRYFDETLTAKRTKREGLFSWEAIQALRQEHRSGHRDASMDLLAILMFDVWHRQYIVNTSVHHA